MSKLHQVLAVEQDRKNKAIKIMGETTKTFQNKDAHFDGLMKVYLPLVEGGETIPPEQKGIVTTVQEKLEYTQGAIIQAINTLLSKEETNCSGAAKTDLIVLNDSGDEVNLGEFSATSLLALEGFMTKIRETYRTVPTLDPAKTWERDTTQDRSVFITPNPTTKYRTEKQETPLVLYEATTEHPAQVKMVTKDERIGSYETTYYSGKIRPAGLSRMLGRIDRIIDAVKRARAKANEAEVVQVNVAGQVFDFIHDGIF